MKIPANEPKLEKLGEATVFRIASASRSGIDHYVTVFHEKHGVHCSCEGWQYRGNCKHVAMVPMEDLPGGEIGS